MKDNRSHIIRTVNVEVSFLQKKQNTKLQNSVKAVIKDDLLPRLEILFDEKTPGQGCIKIDELAVEYELLVANNWQEEFVKTTIKKIKEKLDTMRAFSAEEGIFKINYDKDKTIVKVQEPVQHEMEAMIFFIERGVLPWYAKASDFKEWMETVNEKISKTIVASEMKDKFLRAIFRSGTTFERFVTQLSENAVLYFTRLIAGDEILQQVDFSRIEKLSLKQKKLLKCILLFTQSTLPVQGVWMEELVAQNFSPQQVDVLQTVITEHHDQHHLKPLLKLIEKIKEIFDESRESTAVKHEEQVVRRKTTPSGVIKEKGYFIENAGLVILHPFLDPLFKHLHYTIEGKFENEAMQARAILYTQWLVTGQNEMPEYDLLLNKLLCGYALDNTLENNIVLNQEEENEGRDLLQSVIKHWSALKNTSIEGLRDTFFQRPGKLTERDDHWLLQVEHKTVDVLMNYLPWGIGIIKLPWMEKRLMVEWNS